MSKKYRLTEAGCMLEALRKYGIGFNYYMNKHVDYCPSCGQALDWSEEE